MAARFGAAGIGERDGNRADDNRRLWVTGRVRARCKCNCIKSNRTGNNGAMAPFQVYSHQALRRQYVTFRAYRTVAALTGEDIRRSPPRGRPGRPRLRPRRSQVSPAFVREETGVISICKTILSGKPPEQIRDRTEGLDSAPLRDLAARLAADPNLTVGDRKSVV